MHCLLAKRFVLVAALVMIATAAQAQPKVQELKGHLGPREDVLYNLKGLKKGQKLTIFTEATGGNLDPLILLPRTEVEFENLRTEARADVAEIIQAEEDPILVVPDVLDKYTLAWDDDSGPNGAAALEFEIPADGDYRLLVREAYPTNSFGTYRLLIGLDAEDVLTGLAAPTGAKIAEYARLAEPREQSGRKVSEIQAMLSSTLSPTMHSLNPIRKDETLSVYVEGLTHGLKPILFLTDGNGKPIKSSNFGGQKTSATLTWEAQKDTRNLQIALSSVPPEGEPTHGEYRLLVGINAPEVLEGEAEPEGTPILHQPIPVKVGLSLYQIADIDQKSERYDGVYDLMMRWQDPALAYRPNSPQDSMRMFTGDEFHKYAKQHNIVAPLFTLHNQQGKRWDQMRVTAIFPTGRAIYYERFSTTLQAPDFEFRRFPFDVQKFFARIDMVLPSQYFILEELPKFSHVGKRLGEEEWVVQSFETKMEEIHPPGRQPHWSFSFNFWAHRHLNYYLLRIFLPVFAIVVIAWATFFLKDYGKRVDLAGANLLVFIAFNFTIAGDLPRLGYLTFMDIALISTFVITAVVLILCVFLRHMQDRGHEAFARRVDKYLICFYPVVYILAVGGGALAVFS